MDGDDKLKPDSEIKNLVLKQQLQRLQQLGTELSNLLQPKETEPTRAPTVRERAGPWSSIFVPFVMMSSSPGPRSELYAAGEEDRGAKDLEPRARQPNTASGTDTLLTEHQGQGVRWTSGPPR